MNHLILFVLPIFGLLVSCFVPTTATGDAIDDLINELMKTGKFTNLGISITLIGSCFLVFWHELAYLFSINHYVVNGIKRLDKSD